MTDQTRSDEQSNEEKYPNSAVLFLTKDGKFKDQWASASGANIDTDCPHCNKGFKLRFFMDVYKKLGAKGEFYVTKFKVKTRGQSSDRQGSRSNYQEPMDYNKSHKSEPPKGKYQERELDDDVPF
jgi:hypothetical protein